MLLFIEQLMSIISLFNIFIINYFIGLLSCVILIILKISQHEPNPTVGEIICYLLVSIAGIGLTIILAIFGFVEYHPKSKITQFLEKPIWKNTGKD
jgi:hypothetical protein